MDNEYLTKEFIDLFEGFTRGHGTYNPQIKDSKGKLVGAAEFIQEPATFTTWLNHLEGKIGIGMGPINDSSKVRWGAIDIDDYTINHLKLITKIEKLNFPIITVKSKSGGAHLMIFLTDWTPAGLVKNKLGEMASALGYARNKSGKPIEIFPRQSVILPDRGDFGNWLNIPYFGGNNSNRYALDVKANRVTLEDFIKLAKKSKITEQQLITISILQNTKVKDEFKNAPPCLSTIIAEGGVDEGSRNTFMYNMAILACKMYPNNKDLRNILIEEWNRDYCHPMLVAKEICLIQSTIERHPDYKYQCKESLLMSYCNTGICKSKQHGLNAACHMPILADLTKLNSNPSIYFLQVNDIRVEFSVVDELIIQTKFQTNCVEHANIMPPTLKRSEWTDLINSLLQDMRIIEASPDASGDAKLEEMLETFAEQMVAGIDKQDITRGLPWFDKSTKKTVFKLSALETFLKNNKFTNTTRGQLISKLKTWGGASKQMKINNKNHNVWEIELDNITTQQYEILIKSEKDIL